MTQDALTQSTAATSPAEAFTAISAMLKKLGALPKPAAIHRKPVDCPLALPAGSEPGQLAQAVPASVCIRTCLFLFVLGIALALLAAC